MADNAAVLPDEDGDYSDWIEIYNPTDTAVDLAGWYLTDDLGEPTQWQFPAVELDPAEFLIVFASGKNRTTPDSELHTNFQLEKDGEDLALLQPDGVTVASQFVSYPSQFEDVSFGIDVSVQTTELLPANSAVRYRIPDQDYAAQVGDSWRGGESPFDDSEPAGWLTGSQPLGFAPDVTNASYEDIVLADAPLVYYRFEADFNDSSGAGKHGSVEGTVTEGVTSASEQLGSAVDFAEVIHLVDE